MTTRRTAARCCWSRRRMRRRGLLLSLVLRIGRHGAGHVTRNTLALVAMNVVEPCDVAGCYGGRLRSWGVLDGLKFSVGGAARVESSRPTGAATTPTRNQYAALSASGAPIKRPMTRRRAGAGARRAADGPDERSVRSVSFDAAETRQSAAAMTSGRGGRARRRRLGRAPGRAAGGLRPKHTRAARTDAGWQKLSANGRALWGVRVVHGGAPSPRQRRRRAGRRPRLFSLRGMCKFVYRRNTEHRRRAARAARGRSRAPRRPHAPTNGVG